MTMAVVVFEDDGWEDFAPLTTLRHVSLLRWGTRTLLDSVRAMAGRDVSLWGREELAATTREVEEVEYNATAAGEVLFVNARAKPDRSILQVLERTGEFVAKSGEQVVATRLNASKMSPGVLSRTRLLKLSKGGDVLELPRSAIFRGSWEMVGSNGLAITEQAERFPDQLELPTTSVAKGPPSNLVIHETADVESHVFFDVRLGPVIVSEGVSLESFTRLSGPCFIGAKTKIHSGLLRGGTSIFEVCRIGGEVENSIIMPHTNKSHLGYVGDSVVGEWVNLGAGSTFSNLKNTYGNVRIESRGERMDTGMMKLGPVVGDMAKVSIGTLVYAGRSVGAASHVAGLVDRPVPSFTFYGGRGERMVELRIDSVLETQRRMVERRGIVLTKAQESLIRAAFRTTVKERRRAHVREGRIG